MWSKTIISVILVSVVGGYDLPSSEFLPPYSRPNGYDSLYQNPSSNVPNQQHHPISVPESYSNSNDANAHVLRQSQNVESDGTYQYSYETDNGIQVEEQGHPKDLGGNPPEIAETVTGAFSYTAPDGQHISISYVADENGFQPVGDHLPTPPPIPEAIQRALQYIESTGGSREYK